MWYILYMCVHVCDVELLCYIFICTLVRSPSDSNEGVKCEARSVGANSKILGGQDKQGIYSGRRTSRRLSLSLERGHEGCIREVLQEDGCSSMSKLCLCVLATTIITSSYHDYLIFRDWLQCWLVFIFHGLKIIHVSHELILESGTVANNVI